MAVTTKNSPALSSVSNMRDAVKADLAKPTSAPPDPASQEGGIGAVGTESVPLTLSDDELARMLGSSSALIAPTVEPPALAETAGAGATTSLWKTGKVTSLWSINQNRNSWAGFDGGTGWLKFANNSDTAITAFTTLASHARCAQGQTSFRQESSYKMIHEFYVW